MKKNQKMMIARNDKSKATYETEIAEDDMPCDLCNRLIRKGSKYAHCSSVDDYRSHLDCHKYYHIYHDFDIPSLRRELMLDFLRNSFTKDVVNTEVTRKSDKRSIYTSIVSSIRRRYQKKLYEEFTPDIYFAIAKLNSFASINSFTKNNELSILLKDFSVSISVNGDYIRVIIDTIIESFYNDPTNDECHELIDALTSTISILSNYQLKVVYNNVLIERLFLSNGIRLRSLIDPGFKYG